MEPKPVYPRKIHTHGLLGISNVRQHMMVDERWSPASITDEFKQMTDLLTKRYTYMRLKNAAAFKGYATNFLSLRRQCSDGRTKLQMSLRGENSKAIHRALVNHKKLQRMYNKMTIHEVADSINQRTFVMRKERDRLNCRMNELKEIYRKKLHERAFIENRIKYESLSVLEEDIKSREIRKNIANSHVRVLVTQSINTTFKKLIQILRQDSIFYEPILRSLDQDIKDQADFIKHILFLGMPGIAHFKELNESFRVRTSTKSQFQQKVGRRKTLSILKPTEETVRLSEAERESRYARETPRMRSLQTQLQDKENNMKLLKFATLCNSSKEVCTRILTQLDKNRKLHSLIESDSLTRAQLNNKLKRADVLETVLVNNVDDEELERHVRIRELQEKIAEEGHKTAKILAHMKDRANAYLVLRFSLWNLEDILRHVDRAPRKMSVVYPNSYLYLPLLKFEMFELRAVPPEVLEDNVDRIVHQLQRKVNKLMKAYSYIDVPEKLEELCQEYQETYLDSKEFSESSEDEEEGIDALVESLDTKPLQTVPTRKQIKEQSAKLVEEHLKKELE